MRIAIANVWAVIGLLLPIAALAAEAEIRIVRDDNGQPTAFEAVGLEPAALAGFEQLASPAELFAVHVIDEGGKSAVPALAGSYRLHEDRLRFTPRYALRPGMQYRVVARSPGIVREISIPPEKPSAPTRIVRVFPSAESLPENQLKFYVHFSAAMGRGSAYEHVRLLNDQGKAVESPFLEIGEELWDRSGKRLTLFIDPGRIKQGVQPREEIGTVLEAGRRYTLVLDKTWTDAAGQPLAADYQKQFAVGGPASAALDPSDWTIKAPSAGTREPLVVAFPAPLDHALLLRTIRVRSETAELTGEAFAANAERSWRFLPAAAWSPGKHTLVVDTVLEDLAGNRIGSAFEVDQLNPLQKRVEVETVELPFSVPTPAR